MPINSEIKNIITAFISTHELNIAIQKKWENFSGTVRVKQALILDIHNQDSLIRLQQFIYSLNQTLSPDQKITVRVAAGGKKGGWHSESFSLTDCAVGDIIYRLVGPDFNQVGFASEEDKQQGLVSVGGSLQVHELDKLLWDLKLRTTTSTLVPYVTVAGLLATASHGTGREQPAYAGLVESMTLLLETGEVITLNKLHPLFADIVGAHFGLFGIVLKVTLQCKPAERLKITRTPASFPKLVDEIEKGLFDHSCYVNVLYMPTPESIRKGTENALIVTMNPVSINSYDMNRTAGLDTDELGIRIAEKFGLFDVVAAHSGIKSFYRKQILSSQIGSEEKISVVPWYELHYQTAFPKKMSDMHWLLPVKNNTDIRDIVMALQHLIERMDYPFMFGILLRCFAGTNGGLSSSHHRDDEYILTVDVVSKLNEPSFEAFKQEWGAICQARGGKPHWGKALPTDFNAADYYGEQHSQFLKTYQLFCEEYGLDPENNLFANEYANLILKSRPTACLDKDVIFEIPSRGKIGLFSASAGSSSHLAATSSNCSPTL